MIMFDQPKFDWRKIVVWNDKEIKGFFGDYRFLSNFELATVWFEGIKYTSSENAYMAAKTLDFKIRQEIAGLSAYQAKKLGHKIKLRDNWEQIKKDYMLRIIFEKFAANPNLKEKLLLTENKYLEETNWWHDTIWGVDYRTQKGENNLGQILMKVRECLR